MSDIRVNTFGADWLLVKQWITLELDAAKERLESPKLQFDETTFERGRVAALRSMLEEFEPKQTPQVEDVNYG